MEGVPGLRLKAVVMEGTGGFHDSFKVGQGKQNNETDNRSQRQI